VKIVIKPYYYFSKGAQDCLNVHVNNLKLLGIAKGDDNLNYIMNKKSTS
jgi:hypothetical protein